MGLRQIRGPLFRAPRPGSMDLKSLIPRFQEKPLSFRSRGTVPQTDTGRQGENPKALERTRVKELGKIVP
jgi:hypothetical protein